MGAQTVVGILTPSISLLFAIVFFVFWRKNRALGYVRDFAASYALVAIAFGQTAFWSAPNTAITLVICSSGATFSIIPITHAFLTRQKLKSPLKILGLIWAMGASCAAVAGIGFENINQMASISCIAAAMMYLCLAWQLKIQKTKSGVDQFIPNVLLVTALSLIIQSAFIWSSNVSLGLNTFKDSATWITINMIVIMQCCAIAVAIAMIAVSDSMNMLSEQAMKDELSGLQRRERFEEITIQNIEKARRGGVPVSLVVCDLDHFKKINDTHGHLAGDDVIKAFGEIIRQTARSTDIIGRIGGEEFALLLWNADHKGAHLVAQQLRSALANCDLTDAIGDTPCTASFGVAQWNGRDNYRDLFSLADKALYLAKHSGRDCVKIAHSEIAIAA